MPTVRRVFATLLVIALVLACALTRVIAVEALPELEGNFVDPQGELGQPIVPLDNFANEGSWMARWQEGHAMRVAQGTMIETDRPTFTLAPTTVPQGWVQLETGFLTTSTKFDGYTYDWTNLPQMNLRLGILPRVELRALWGGVATKRVHRPGYSASYGGTSSLEFGAKFQVSQQRRWIPQSALVTDVIIPTGDYYGAPYQLTTFYAWKSASPLIDYIYFWRLGRFSIGGSSGWVIGTNGGTTVDHYFQSAVVKFHWTPRLTLFTEYYAVYSDPYYGGGYDAVDAGVKWRFFNNAQVDWIIGVPGVADAIFTSAGFSFRY